MAAYYQKGNFFVNKTLPFSTFTKLVNSGVIPYMDVSQIRLYNARMLAKAAGGSTAMADKIGRSQSQVSQLLKDQPAKNIGKNIARRIEQAFGKPHGWLDQPHPELWPSAPESLEDKHIAISDQTEPGISPVRAVQEFSEALSKATPVQTAIVKNVLKLPWPNEGRLKKSEQRQVEATREICNDPELADAILQIRQQEGWQNVLRTWLILREQGVPSHAIRCYTSPSHNAEKSKENNSLEETGGGGLAAHQIA